MSIVHLTFFAIGVVFIAGASFYKRGHFQRWTWRWSQFNLCFFVTAGLVNGLWSYLIFGRLYWSTDYVSDFTPFWPITQGVIDAPFGDQVGRLMGISLRQLQAIWLAFALTTWLSTFALYRACRKGARRHAAT